MIAIRNEISKFLVQFKKIPQSIMDNKFYEGFNQREALIAMSENLKLSNKRLKEANRELSTIFNKIDEALFSIDLVNNNVTQMSMFFKYSCLEGTNC